MAGRRKIPVKITTTIRIARSEMGAFTDCAMPATPRVAAANRKQHVKARRRSPSPREYTQAAACGISKMPVSVKSRMKIKSQAGRGQVKGEHNNVSNLGNQTRPER